MQRLAGQDAIFLYRETPTSMMHTLKVLIIKLVDANISSEEIYGNVTETLASFSITHQRIMPVPFGFHHPVMIDDPDFDIDAHVFRAAIPSPGGMGELDNMVAQIGSTLLDRSRPLWEMWILEGLKPGHIVLVHKVHHALLDGMAYANLLNIGWEEKSTKQEQNPVIAPLPSATRLVWEAALDHLKHDIWHLWPILKSFVGNLKELSVRHKASKEPRINPLTAKFPRTRFNHALTVKRSFSTSQISLDDIKALKNKLGVTLNDVILAVVAGALRNYLVSHDELPADPLALSIPVGADEPGSQRQMGNNVTSLISMLHIQTADPLERLHAIKKDTELGKEDLEVFGKHQWGELMEYIPPVFMTWYCRRNFRLKPCNKDDFNPNTNLVISNVPGPRVKLGNSEGELEALYSVGPLGEGMGLNITVWSYAGQLNIGALACHKAMPDIRKLTDAIPAALEELQLAAQGVEA